MNCQPLATQAPSLPIRVAMQRFTELKVWQVAHAWVLDVYRATRGFPADERYGLTAQLRRSAASVPSNIAEGAKRRTPADYARFLNIAEASLSEAEYHLILARDLSYASSHELRALSEGAAEIGRMLHGLRTRVEARA